MILCPDLADVLQTSTSDAERRVARLLHAIPGGNEAVAFHSVKLRSHPRKQEAEADFVVLWNGVVIVLEVKGGGVRNHQGKWWSIDRRSDWHELRESPMDQAKGAMYALRDILQTDGLGRYPDQHGVITPDVDDLTAAIGWLPTHWLSQSHMTVLGLKEALDQIARSARNIGNDRKRARIVDVRQRLFGEFSRMPRLDAQRGAVLEEQNRATAGQARFLEGLARNPRLLVLGGAGTGKSLALVEGAKQEADLGQSVLITFKSPGLANYFETMVAGREIAVLPFDDIKCDAEFDVVFIDEAQDLMTTEDMDRIDRVLIGGSNHGRWRMFLDPNNQAHVHGDFDEVTFELIAIDAVKLELPTNVRNTKHIVQVVQNYLGADIGDPAIVNGGPVVWHETDGPADLAYAKSLVDELVGEGASPRSIWIIDASSVALPSVDKRGVTVTSPRHAKGLEADRVVVCNLPENFDSAGKSALYVAVTRARVGLHIALSRADNKRLKELARTNLEQL